MKSLPGKETRPTSDKVKESLFNRIGPYFAGGVVVDLFGGSGSMALEALSRGANEAIIFEKNPRACSIIKANAEKSKFVEQIYIEQKDARNAVQVLKRHGKEIMYLFIDPPYAEEKFYDLAQQIANAGLLSEQAMIVCEHEKNTPLPDTYGDYLRRQQVVYGASALSIYKK